MDDLKSMRSAEFHGTQAKSKASGEYFNIIDV